MPAGANERHRLHDDVARIRLEVTIALVARHVRRPPDFDRVKPVRAKHRPGVVNGHHGD